VANTRRGRSYRASGVNKKSNMYNNNTMGLWDFIRAGRCDMCFVGCSGVQMHSSGARTVFICKVCDHELYNSAAEREKREWIKYGKIKNQRRRSRSRG